MTNYYLDKYKQFNKKYIFENREIILKYMNEHNISIIPNNKEIEDIVFTHNVKEKINYEKGNKEQLKQNIEHEKKKDTDQHKTIHLPYFYLLTDSGIVKWANENLKLELTAMCPRENLINSIMEHIINNNIPYKEYVLYTPDFYSMNKEELFRWIRKTPCMIGMKCNTESKKTIMQSIENHLKLKNINHKPIDIDHTDCWYSDE